MFVAGCAGWTLCVTSAQTHPAKIAKSELYIDPFWFKNKINDFHERTLDGGSKTLWFDVRTHSSKMLSKSESCKQQKEHSKWPKHSNWSHLKQFLHVLQRTIMLTFFILKYFGDVNRTPSFWGEAVNGGRCKRSLGGSKGSSVDWICIFGCALQSRYYCIVVVGITIQPDHESLHIHHYEFGMSQSKCT